MPTLVRMLAIVALSSGIASVPLPSPAQERGPVRITSDIQYEFLDRWDVDRLNRILQVDTPKFAGLSVAYSSAPRRWGCIASLIPRWCRNAATSRLPRQELPRGSRERRHEFSNGLAPARNGIRETGNAFVSGQSPETQVMIAQFAGQGYVLIGADYFGMGPRTSLRAIW